MMDGMGIEPHLYQQGFALLKWENRAWNFSCRCPSVMTHLPTSDATCPGIPKPTNRATDCPLLKHVDWWECSYDEGPKGQDIYVEEQLGWCVEASGQKRGCKPHPEISHQQFPSGTQ
jgi:hypothetical protein